MQLEWSLIVWPVSLTRARNVYFAGRARSRADYLSVGHFCCLMKVRKRISYAACIYDVCHVSLTRACNVCFAGRVCPFSSLVIKTRA